jgi:hypothetical protein
MNNCSLDFFGELVEKHTEERSHEKEPLGAKRVSQEMPGFDGGDGWAFSDRIMCPFGPGRDTSRQAV